MMKIFLLKVKDSRVSLHQSHEIVAYVWDILTKPHEKLLYDEILRNLLSERKRLE